MGPSTAIIFLAAVLAVAVVAWGGVTRRRSIVVALVALGVAGLAALLSYYALVESQSVPWAVGYGVAAVLSAAVCRRHLAGRLVKSRG
jgi:hypothetical protein